VAKAQENRIAKRIEQRVVQATIQSFSGPLPPPEVLVRYNDAVPDGAKRLMDAAERQSTHRQTLEARVIGANIFDQRLGVILGFILAMSVAAGGFYLIHAGHNAGGIAAVITSIGGPSGVFIWGRRKQAKERDEKASSFPTFTR